MAFLRAEWRRRETQRDPATNNVVALFMTFELFDDATTATLMADVLVQGDPLTLILSQPDAASRRQALIAYVRPLLKRQYMDWKDLLATRIARQPDDVSADAPITNLG